MAQKARKELARTNAAALKQLHLGSLVANVSFVLFSLALRRRSLFAYIFLSTPAFIAQYILEKSGRPKYDGNTQALKASGEDLAAPGLTEYMFDIIWVTWACLCLVVVLGDWAWWTYSIVPLYGLYKAAGLLGMLRGMRGGPSMPMAMAAQDQDSTRTRQSRKASHKA